MKSAARRWALPAAALALGALAWGFAQNRHPAHRFCDRVNDAACERIDECDPRKNPWGVEACKRDRPRSGLSCWFFADAYEANAAPEVFDSDAASRCLDDVRVVSCEEIQRYGMTLPPTCHPSRVFHP